MGVVMFRRVVFPLALALLALPPSESALAGSPSRKAQLGRLLFLDTNLSNPPGQSCASCHRPDAFFADPNGASPTSAGAIPTLKGSRNAPTLLYARFSPAFHFDRVEGLFIGGQFLDGRAASLREQAKGPFLNPIEMANPDLYAVVDKVRRADYAGLFRRVYGAAALEQPDRAFNRVADALAAFERSSGFARFDSKYDYFLRGKAKLTALELRGRALFEDPEKGNCAACHPSRPSEDGEPPLFTDFSYDNLGVPRNPDNPFYAMPVAFNPAGKHFVDRGLGARVHAPEEDGKFKVPTLRNIAKTAPYMHNGYFKSLRGVVDFYSSRDIKPSCASAWNSESQANRQGCWPAAEVEANVNHAELGALNLSDDEIDAIVAFLGTLTDGYRPD